MAYRLSMFISSVLVITGLSVSGFGQSDWPTCGHDAASSRHSPLKQIDTSNVSKLARAWTYHMTPANAAAEHSAAGARAGGDGGQRSEATPIIVDGVMYLPTPNNHSVIAFTLP